MGMMALGIAAGQTVTISADGEDETQAIDSIEKIFRKQIVSTIIRKRN